MPTGTDRTNTYSEHPKASEIEIENYRNPEGTALLEYLEDNGFEAGTDYELGREVNDKFDDESTPIVRYNEEGFGKKVRSGTDKVLEVFGLEEKSFKDFKKSGEN